MTATSRAALRDAAARAAQGMEGFESEAARARFAHDLLAPIASHALVQHHRGARVLGIYGAQGSGKTTLAACLATLLQTHAGLRVAVLSLDDFYLTRAHRLRVAARLHPLFETRGVPGTHDIPLLLRTLDALLALDPLPSSQVAASESDREAHALAARHARLVPVPRFDKAHDDRAPSGAALVAPVDVVLLEGWCLGVPPEPPERLAEPCNELEATHDRSGRFRRCVNHRLAHDYAALAQRVDWLVALMVSSFEVSCAQRSAQEQQLRARHGVGMSDADVARFMLRYERVSRWALTCMSERADLSIPLDEHHVPRGPVPWA